MLILTICFKPHPTNVLSSCTTLSPLLSRNPGPQKKFCPYPKPICISLDRSNTVGTFDPLLEKPTDSLVNICIWPTLPGKTSLEKEALEPSLVKKNTLTRRTLALSVPTHGSMLILVSSFTTQMLREPSTWSRKHTRKNLNKTGLSGLSTCLCGHR